MDGVTQTMGILPTFPARDRLDLLAEPVAKAVTDWSVSGVPVDELRIAEIDPSLADTAAFCETYQVGMDISANCVVVAAKRGGSTTYAACMVLATGRADVNGVVRRHLGARKASFAPMDSAVSLTGMEYGGITPVGLPAGWPVLVDAAVASTPYVVIGSGLRRSKLLLPGRALAGLPGAEVLELSG